MSVAQSPAGSWRARVQQWLNSAAYDSQAVTFNLRQSVTRLRGSFPKSLLLIVANFLAKSLAKWLIQSALLDLAPATGIALDESEASIPRGSDS